MQQRHLRPLLSNSNVNRIPFIHSKPHLQQPNPPRRYEENPSQLSEIQESMVDNLNLVGGIGRGKEEERQDDTLSRLRKLTGGSRGMHLEGRGVSEIEQDGFALKSGSKNQSKTKQIQLERASLISEIVNKLHYKFPQGNITTCGDRTSKKTYGIQPKGVLKSAKETSNINIQEHASPLQQPTLASYPRHPYPLSSLQPQPPKQSTFRKLRNEIMMIREGMQELKDINDSFRRQNYQLRAGSKRRHQVQLVSHSHPRGNHTSRDNHCCQCGGRSFQIRCNRCGGLQSFR